MASNILSERSASALLPFLEQILPVLFQSASDPEERLRYTALYVLGTFSLEFKGLSRSICKSGEREDEDEEEEEDPGFQDMYHTSVLPLLFTSIQAHDTDSPPHPRILHCALHTLAVFCDPEHCRESYVSAHAGGLLDFTFSLLSGPNPLFIKEQALVLGCLCY